MSKNIHKKVFDVGLVSSWKVFHHDSSAGALCTWLSVGSAVMASTLDGA
jgi:hypothetical protein